MPGARPKVRRKTQQAPKRRKAGTDSSESRAGPHPGRMTRSGSWTGPDETAKGWSDQLRVDQHRAVAKEFRELDRERVLVLNRPSGREDKQHRRGRTLGGHGAVVRITQWPRACLSGTSSDRRWRHRPGRFRRLGPLPCSRAISLFWGRFLVRGGGASIFRRRNGFSRCPEIG